MLSPVPAPHGLDGYSNTVSLEIESAGSSPSDLIKSCFSDFSSVDPFI
jgi:hypothetical protein